MQHRHPSINTLTSLLGRNQTAPEGETPRLLPFLRSQCFHNTLPAPYSTDFFLLSILSLFSLPVPVHFMSISSPVAPLRRYHSRCLLLSLSLAFPPTNISNLLNFQPPPPSLCPCPGEVAHSFQSFPAFSLFPVMRSYSHQSLFPRSRPLESWILVFFPRGSFCRAITPSM